MRNVGAFGSRRGGRDQQLTGPARLAMHTLGHLRGGISSTNVSLDGTRQPAPRPMAVPPRRARGVSCLKRPGFGRPPWHLDRFVAVARIRLGALPAVGYVPSHGTSTGAPSRCDPRSPFQDRRLSAGPCSLSSCLCHPGESTVIHHRGRMEFSPERTTLACRLLPCKPNRARGLSATPVPKPRSRTRDHRVSQPLCSLLWASGS